MIAIIKAQLAEEIMDEFRLPTDNRALMLKMDRLVEKVWATAVEEERRRILEMFANGTYTAESLS